MSSESSEMENKYWRTISLSGKREFSFQLYFSAAVVYLFSGTLDACDKWATPYLQAVSKPYLQIWSFFWSVVTLDRVGNNWGTLLLRVV